MSKAPEVPEKSDFQDVLEQGVRSVLGNRKATASEKLQAVAAGVKLLAIRHKISGNDESGFFS
jgi:hypothetical protein